MASQSISLPFTQSLPGVIIDLDKVAQLLGENGFNNYLGPEDAPATGHFGERFLNSTAEVRRKLEELCTKARFVIPKKPVFSLFYILDYVDGKNSFLYLPDCLRHFNNPSPSLDKITKVSEELTKLIPLPLLAIYEGDMWKLPIVRQYERGKIQTESTVMGGNQEFDPDWERHYWERMSGRSARDKETWDRAGELFDRIKANQHKRIKKK